MAGTWKDKLQGLLQAYGPVVVGVWFGVFALTWGSFIAALMLGFDVGGAEVDGAGGWLSVVGGAYFATQLTKPARIAATLFLTPLVARWLGRKATEPLEPEPEPEEAA